MKLITKDDVGVLLFGFNRPDLLKRRVLELFDQRVINLYISIDGNPGKNSAEMSSVKAFSNELFKDSKNFKIFHHKKNLGMVDHFNHAVNKVLTNHKYIIFIEDDIKLSKNFLSNMLIGFNKQSTLGKKGFISGFSPLHSTLFQNKWRKSIIPFVWSCGFSREIWNLYESDLNKIDWKENLTYSKSWAKLSKHQQKDWLSRFQRVNDHPKYTYDCQMVYTSFIYEFTNLLPVFAMVGNEGFNDGRSAHTAGSQPRFVNNLKLNEKTIKKVSKVSKVYNLYDVHRVHHQSFLMALFRKVTRKVT
jgi:hypothetical protein